MAADRDPLLSAETPRELFEAMPSYGPHWDAAIEQGVDVALLESNLRLSPTERLLRHQDLLRLFWELRRSR